MLKRGASCERIKVRVSPEQRQLEQLGVHKEWKLGKNHCQRRKKDACKLVHESTSSVFIVHYFTKTGITCCTQQSNSH